MRATLRTLPQGRPGMLRRCRGCKLEKDAARDYFPKRTHCKVCHAGKSKKRVFPTEAEISEMYAGRRYDDKPPAIIK